VGSENLKPIEEIKALSQQVDLALDLAELEPIRQRVEQLYRENPGDPEVHKAAEDVKRLLQSRAARLTPSTRSRNVDLPTASFDLPGGPPTLDGSSTTIPDDVLPTLPSASGPVDPHAPEAQGIEWQRALWMGVAVGVVQAHPFVADLEGEQELPARGEHPVKLVEQRRQLLRRGVNDRVPRDDATQHPIAQVKPKHRTDVKP